jgi:tripartite-type tricarboxylate transporter receptor subunit TctC
MGSDQKYKTMRQLFLRLLSCIFHLTPFIGFSAQAQEYPAKPIRYIVATAPGGLMDVPARLLADYFEKRYGQRLVVENRGGGGGVMAGDAVAKAAPDGYTLAQIQVGNVAINPFTVKDMPFDPLRDFAPVSTLTSSPVVVTVDGRLGVNTLQEFIALAKTRSLNYGSAGIGTIPHLSGELFAHAAGIKMTPVHYRGAGPALNDLLAGQVQAIFVGLGVVRSQSSVKMLAVSQPKRLAAAPEIPTAAEAGLPAFEVNTWFGVVAPRGTPEAIVNQLNRQIHAALDDATAQKRLNEGGLEPLKDTPAQFGARMRADHERFREIVKAAGLKPE